ncbi:MAG: hypothetical protein J7M27_08355 [Candidatus Latescibacteria bacterium]|nr:hypothetical protein [Candidatus Latescibacterota bacterium]
MEPVRVPHRTSRIGRPASKTIPIEKDVGAKASYKSPKNEIASLSLAMTQWLCYCHSEERGDEEISSDNAFAGAS